MNEAGDHSFGDRAHRHGDAFPGMREGSNRGARCAIADAAIPMRRDGMAQTPVTSPCSKKPCRLFHSGTGIFRKPFSAFRRNSGTTAIPFQSIFIAWHVMIGKLTSAKNRDIAAVLRGISRARRPGFRCQADRVQRASCNVMGINVLGGVADFDKIT
ncbi:hypothetical protein [Burkholderia sp. ABCPW 14]|uniref:hypothetical protein n=1 Tax=Burkholderia sp. ABCPW 14 TaxID=1637860 RepID=UPI000A7053DE|nr:hypothetical protein [Burkholderia sp. ABCPW 14]